MVLFALPYICCSTVECVKTNPFLILHVWKKQTLRAGGKGVGTMGEGGWVE